MITVHFIPFGGNLRRLLHQFSFSKMPITSVVLALFERRFYLQQEVNFLDTIRRIRWIFKIPLGLKFYNYNSSALHLLLLKNDIYFWSDQSTFLVNWDKRWNQNVYSINHIVNGVVIPICFQLYMDGILTFWLPVSANKTILIIHKTLNARRKFSLRVISPLSMCEAIRYAISHIFLNSMN